MVPEALSDRVPPTPPSASLILPASGTISVSDAKFKVGPICAMSIQSYAMACALSPKFRAPGLAPIVHQGPKQFTSPRNPLGRSG